MRKQLLSMVLICVLLLSVTACGNYTITDEDSSPPQSSTENPFENADGDGMLGAISHGPSNPNRAEDQSMLPYEYNGGEMILEYRFSAQGKLENIGFLVFLDGKPQAYKVNDEGAEYEYCHSFQVTPDKEETISFIFTPNTGKSGDTLNLTVVSITNVDFKPDMETTSSYGWYHKHLERNLKLHFNIDAPESKELYGANDIAFSKVDITNETISSSYIENELPLNGWNGITIDNLDNNLCSTISYDGKLVYDNIDISNKDTLVIRYTLCGTPGVEYEVSFFADHKPLSFNELTSYNVTLNKGRVYVIEATIDTAKLDDFTTFYVVAACANDNDSVPAKKTDSILLYKEN